MFVSFFPRPRLFFLSAVLWTALAMAVWYGFASNLVGSSAPGGAPAVGVAMFWSPQALWFDLYFAVCVAIFAAAWMVLSPHPWAWWSILGSALILFTTYFQVQVSVAINSWYGPFYDLIQAALSKSRPVTSRAVLQRIVDLRRHRAGRGRGRRADAVLRQPLHLPLAHGDERLLHRQLAAAAHHRGRLAARAGRHHAVCDHRGRPRRQPHQRRADADRLPAGAGEALQQYHRAAAGRRHPLSAGVRRGDLVGVRHRRCWR